MGIKKAPTFAAKGLFASHKTLTTYIGAIKMDFNLKINQNNNKKNNKKLNKNYSKELHKKAYFESEKQCNETLYDTYHKYENLLSAEDRHIISSEIENVFWRAYKLGKIHGENIATAEAIETMNQELEVSDE